MIAKVCLSVFLIGAILAHPDRPSSNGYNFQQPQPQPSYSQPQPSYQQESKEEGMPFEFAYEVKDEYTGNDFSHASDSDGHVTKGEYRVLLPDGRTQIVTYTADHDTGYVAEVTYEGEAKPQEPSYGQPQPSYQPKPKPDNLYGK